MIPKVRSAAGALEQGVGRVFIGEYTQSGDLEKTLSGSLGTLIDSGGDK
jgi:acetylglutamate kinase